jgi:hypothetical protein
MSRRATLRASVDVPGGLALLRYEGEVPAPPMRRVIVRAHRRWVTGDAPPSGAERRDAALDTHERSAATRTALTYVRAKLAELYALRCRIPTWKADPYVTADDVESILAEWAACPAEILELPTQKWRGQIFRTGWKKTGGSVESTRPHMRATSLPCWRPVEGARG